MGRTSGAGGANRGRRAPEGGVIRARRGTRAGTGAGISGSGADSGSEVEEGLFNQVPKEIWLKTCGIREGIRILTLQRACLELAGDRRTEIMILHLGALRTLASGGGDACTGRFNQLRHISDTELAEGSRGVNDPSTTEIQHVLGHRCDQGVVELGRVDIGSGVAAADVDGRDD